jgi:hypothetical protein
MLLVLLYLYRSNKSSQNVAIRDGNGSSGPDSHSRSVEKNHRMTKTRYKQENAGSRICSYMLETIFTVSYGIVNMFVRKKCFGTKVPLHQVLLGL